MSYCVLTPVAPEREEVVFRYKKGIERLNPSPAKVGIVTTTSLFNRNFNSNSLYQLVDTPPANRKEWERYKRIAHNRRKLNRWFYGQRNEDYILWIDSDTEIIYSNTAELMIKIAENNSSYGVINPTQARANKKPSYGLGCTLLHRDICRLSEFFTCNFTLKDNEDEKINYTIGEAVIYLSLLEENFKKFQGNIEQKRKSHWPKKIERNNLFFKLEYEEIPAVHHTPVFNYNERKFVDLLEKDAGKRLKKKFNNIRISSVT